MFSKDLKEFVETHKPASLTLTLSQVHDLVAELMKPELELRLGRGRWDPDLEDHLEEGQAVLIAWGGPSTCKKRVKRWGLFGPKWVEVDECQRSRHYVNLEEITYITWWPAVEGDKVTYTPSLEIRGVGSLGRVLLDPREELLKALGLHSVVVELPEKAISLPRCPWDTSYVSGMDGMVEDTITCFESEVGGYVLPFVRQLAELADFQIHLGSG
jgi:hypothetical protein